MDELNEMSTQSVPKDGVNGIDEEDAQYWKDLYLRAVADYDNLQKTIPRRVDEQIRYRLKAMNARWLDVADAFCRATAFEGFESAPLEWREGFLAVRRLFDKTIEKNGLKPVDQLERFDPNIHEALSVCSDPSRENGTIVHVMQDGWTMDGELLRPAGVVVVKNK